MQADAKSVMVVEDDADILDALAGILRDDGYAVVEACDGQEAMDMLRAGPPPDAMILDLMMPRLNGFDVIERLKTQPQLARIRVIVHSANRGYNAEDLGVFAVVRKPASIEDLLGSVNRAVA